jgi:hypothetical protein
MGAPGFLAIPSARDRVPINMASRAFDWMEVLHADHVPFETAIAERPADALTGVLVISVQKVTLSKSLI